MIGRPGRTLKRSHSLTQSGWSASPAPAGSTGIWRGCRCSSQAGTHPHGRPQAGCESEFKVQLENDWPGSGRQRAASGARGGHEVYAASQSRLSGSPGPRARQACPQTLPGCRLSPSGGVTVGPAGRTSVRVLIDSAAALRGRTLSSKSPCKSC